MRRLGLLAFLGVTAVLAVAAAAPAGAASLRIAAARFEESLPVSTDGVPAPGERGILRISLSNEGGATQSGVTGRLSVVAPSGATVIAGTTSWPDVPPRSCMPDAGTLVVEIDASVACAGLLEMQIEVTSAPDGVAMLSLRLPIGPGNASARGVLPVSAEASREASVAWSGAELGVAWRRADGAASHFIRLDGGGSPIESRFTLGGVGPCLTPSLAHGGGRWAVARIQGGRLLLWLLDAGGGTSEIDLGALPEPDVAGPALAWDGTGWSIATYVNVRTPARSTNVHFVHAAADGTLDAGPLTWSAGEELAYSPQMLWTGDELVLLLDRGGESRIAFLSPMGDVLHVSRRVAHGLYGATLGWNGRVFALAATGAYAPHAVVLDRCGEPLTATVPLDVWDQPDLGAGSWTVTDGAVAMSIEDGGLFALAVSRRAVVGGFGSEDQWVEIHRFDEGVHAMSPPERITPADAERWAASLGCAWRPDAQEHVVAVLHDPDWVTVLGGQGALDLARSPVGAHCPDGEPPREVSSARGGVPLLARKELRSACGACDVYADVVLSVEDLGADASSYNIIAASEIDRFRPYWASCHHQVGGDPPATRVGGGRIELTVVATRSIEDDSGQPRILISYRVSASNAWGEGRLGTDSSGVPTPVTNACLDDRP